MDKNSLNQSTVASVRSRYSRGVAWGLLVVVWLLAVLAWGGMYDWRLWPISVYEVFPLLGLLAFSTLWVTYMATAMKTYWRLKSAVLAPFFRWGGYVALVLICLHPGLLMYQRFRDGYGLPPGSYESYVAPSLAWLTLLGTASLLVFLAFELRRFFGRYRWWHYVADASDLAMLAVMYHGLRLGQTLQQGWFRGVWLFYFITLVWALIYKYTGRYQLAKRP